MDYMSSGDQTMGGSPIDVNEYLKKKYGLGEYSPDARAQLVQGVQEAASPIASAISAFGAGIAGRDVGSAFNNAMNASQAGAKEQLNQFDVGKQNAIQDFKTDVALRDDQAAQEKLARERDPNSFESKTAQSLAKSMGFKGDTSSLTAEQFKGFSPALEKQYEITQRSLDRKELANARAELLKGKANETLARQQEQDMMKLSKDVTGAQDAVRALDEVEKTLGFKLDDAQVKRGELYVGDKKKDLPGVSVPLIGRVSAYSDAARDLQSAAATVFNTVLKDRSGAAVTSPELERLKVEFGQGKYNSEPELIGALQRYKRGVKQELANREAAYRPDVVAKYAEQGGRTSSTVSGPSNVAQIKKQSTEPDMVNIIAPNGKMKQVSEKEVDYYLSKGAKLPSTSVAGGLK